MIRKIKIAAIIGLGGYSVWFVLSFAIAMRQGYKVDVEMHKEYKFLFADSTLGVTSAMDGSSRVQSSNILNAYHYPSKCRTYIWEFKDLKSLCVDSIRICLDDGISHVDIKRSQILNSGGSYPIEVRRPLDFKGGVSVNLNDRTKVLSYIKSKNYTGFTGLVGRISLCDKNNEHQIVFHNYSDLKPALFVLYKGYGSFFLIMVRSNSETGMIDDEMLKIFNLE